MYARCQSPHLCSLLADSLTFVGASWVVQVVKNSPANGGVERYMGSIPGSGRSPGEGNGNPLQYSCLKNPVDRGAWLATVQRFAESDMIEHTRQWI